MPSCLDFICWGGFSWSRPCRIFCVQENSKKEKEDEELSFRLPCTIPINTIDLPLAPPAPLTVRVSQGRLFQCARGAEDAKEKEKHLHTATSRERGSGSEFRPLRERERKKRHSRKGRKSEEQAEGRRTEEETSLFGLAGQDETRN